MADDLEQGQPGQVHLPDKRPESKKNLALWLVGGALCLVVVLLAASAFSGGPSGGTGGDAATKESAADKEAQESPVVVEDTADDAADDAAEEDAPKESEKADDPQRKEREALAAKLNEDIAAVASSAGMQVGVCAIDLTTGAVAGYQADTAMVSASMIKVIVAAAVCEQVEAGAFGLDDYATLEAADVVGGTGVLAGRGVGAQVTYREMLQKMISVSDNTGTNALVRTIGMDAVNATATKLGLLETKLNRLMMDEAAIANGIENYTSAQDVAQLLEMTYRKELVSPASSELILEALEQQEDWGGIRNGLPEGTVFAHKTGTLANARHDGGIVEGEHPFVLVVLCGGDGFSEQGAHDVMAQVASVVYKDITASAA